MVRYNQLICTQSEEFKKEVQKFTAPVYGNYKIQCWGAQGAFPIENLEYVSGKGGYSEGIWRPTTINTIYICLGQLGSAAYIKDQIARLAYNNRPDNINGFLLGGSGGGATSVTVTNRGELKYFASNKNEVLIVAGGGGALEWAGQGGAGGGLTGKEGNPKPNECRKGIGGSQDSGGITGVHSGDTSVNGMFGVGGYGYTYNDYYKSLDYGTQGGGGWYGGGGASYTRAAGGGSSYIGGELMA